LTRNSRRPGSTVESRTKKAFVYLGDFETWWQFSRNSYCDSVFLRPLALQESTGYLLIRSLFVAAMA
ncbi:MAG: hypothetical protein WAV20_26030, partial [Blastocatellia bacterium]